MKKITLTFALLSLLFFLVQFSYAGIAGDTNGDGKIDIVEAIYTLRISSGLDPNIPVNCSIVAKGDWQTVQNYVSCDVVKHGGSFYIATASHLSKTTNEPLAINAPWEILALKGDAGAGAFTVDGNNINFTGGNVGVGTADPSSALHVAGESIIFQSAEKTGILDCDFWKILPEEAMVPGFISTTEA